MAASSFVIDTGLITDMVDKTSNDPDVIDTMIDEIVTQFNAMLETLTGHFHDGTDARLIYGGTAGWDSEELLFGLVSGIFIEGGI